MVTSTNCLQLLFLKANTLRALRFPAKQQATAIVTGCSWR